MPRKWPDWSASISRRQSAQVIGEVAEQILTAAPGTGPTTSPPQQLRQLCGGRAVAARKPRGKMTRNGHWLRAEAALQQSISAFTGELIFYLGRTRMSGAESCAMRMLQVLAVVLVTMPTLLMALAIPGTAQSPDRVYRLAHIALTEGSEQITQLFAPTPLSARCAPSGRPGRGSVPCRVSPTP